PALAHRCVCLCLLLSFSPFDSFSLLPTSLVSFSFVLYGFRPDLHSFPTRRSSDLTVFESHIREYLITKNINKKVNDLHKSAVKYVNAKAQATIIHNIENQLTEDELRIYKRGRNQKSHTSPKNADIIQYKNATWLEAII